MDGHTISGLRLGSRRVVACLAAAAAIGLPIGFGAVSAAPGDQRTRVQQEKIGRQNRMRHDARHRAKFTVLERRAAQASGAKGRPQPSAAQSEKFRDIRGAQSNSKLKAELNEAP